MSDANGKKGGPPDVAMLEDVLLALQKTFSRLSATTAQRAAPEHQRKARALIVGEVNFDLTLNVAPVFNTPRAARKTRGAGSADSLSSAPPPVADQLRYCADGSGFPLKLSGRISTDLRMKQDKPEGAPPAPTAARTAPPKPEPEPEPGKPA
jgi:hypothetical protein